MSVEWQPQTSSTSVPKSVPLFAARFAPARRAAFGRPCGLLSHWGPPNSLRSATTRHKAPSRKLGTDFGTLGLDAAAWSFVVRRGTLRHGGAVESRFRAHLVQLRTQSAIQMELVKLVMAASRTKLRARSLWRLPPAYLDYPELDDWSVAADLEVLALDVIEWAIIRRFRALCARMDAGDNVDGFIFRNIDNFMTERQRRADPIGYATFQWVTKVVEDRCNVEHLTLDGDVCVAKVPSETPPTDIDELRELVGSYPRWTILMRALGRGGAEAGSEMVALFDTLAERAPGGFAPTDLISVLRSSARKWHGALRDNGETNSDETIRHLQHVLASRQLLALLDVAIDRSGGHRRRQQDLRRVLQEWRGAFERGDEMSQADLARKLGMKKTTLSDHVRSLRALVLEIDPAVSDDAPLSIQAEEHGR